MADMANPQRIIDYYGTGQGTSILADGNALRPIGPTSAFIPPAPVPALRPQAGPLVGVAERGFTLGDGVFTSATRPVTPTVSPATPLQLGYRPVIRTPGPGIEGAGDFAPAAAESASTAGGIGLRGLAGRTLGMAGSVLAHPLVVAGSVLQPLASATAAASQQSGLGYQQGVVKTPTMFGQPQGEISTMGISNTNPFTGTPVANVVAASVPSYRNPSPGTSAYARWQADRANFAADDASYDAPSAPRGTQDQFIADQQAPPAPPDKGSGYALVGGKYINYGDIGGQGDPLNPTAHGAPTFTPNGVVAGQADNSKDLIDRAIAGHSDWGTDTAYADEVAKAARVNAASGVDISGVNGTSPVPPAAFKTSSDFGGNFAAAAEYNNNLAKAQDYSLRQQAVDQAKVYQTGELGIRRQTADQTGAYQGGELGLRGREATLKEALAPSEIALRGSMATYHDDAGEAMLNRVDADTALEKQRLANAQAQAKLDATANAPGGKADYAAAETAATSTGGAILPTTALAAIKAGFTTPKKAKTHLFSPDEPAGMYNAQGKMYAPISPGVPAGYTQIGTSGGVAVYQDANGNKVTF